MEVSLTQARLFNKECPIYLVADRQAVQPYLALMNKQNIKVIYADNLKRSSLHKQFLQKTPYKDGLGLYSSERFFYLDELMSQHKLQNVFHLEADVMLYVDLQKLLPFFKARYPGIAATFDNDDRCIPGFVYVSNRKAMHRWASYFAERAPEGHLDMYLTGLFKNSNSSKVIDYLPIVMDTYVAKNTLKSTVGHTAKNPSLFCNNIQLFQSIFDAAAIGQYLGGGDIMHNAPPGFINETCVFNPSYFIYEWKRDEEGRNIPYAIYGNQKFRINNLHIHCKELHLFASYR